MRSLGWALCCAGLGLATLGLLDVTDKGPRRVGTHEWVVAAWKEHDARQDRGRVLLPSGVALGAAGVALARRRET
jgi:hypothetical protein